MTDIFPKEMYLDYTGVIDFRKKKELVADLAEKLKALDLNVTHRKRCIYLLEELLTNAHEYYKKKNLPEEKITLVLEQPDASKIVISISNTVFKSDTKDISRRIQHINSLADQQLEEEYQQALVKELTEDIGGGIGLLSIRMKTGLLFEMNFAEKSGLEHILTLRTTLNLNL
jgi:hypothetical protein